MNEELEKLSQWLKLVKQAETELRQDEGNSAWGSFSRQARARRGKRSGGRAWERGVPQGIYRVTFSGLVRGAAWA